MAEHAGTTQTWVTRPNLSCTDRDTLLAAIYERRPDLKKG